jgi:hypothetical protein
MASATRHNKAQPHTAAPAAGATAAHQPAPGSPAPARPGRPLLWACLFLLAAAGVALGYRQIASPDLGFHLALGRWTVEHGALPRTDPLTYTVGEHQCINLQWLFDVGVYGLHQLAGPPGIVVANMLLTMMFGALLLVRSWRRDGRLPASSVLLVVLFALGNYWEPRPHVLSWLWGSLMLLVLEERSRGRRGWLWLLPVMMLLWVNTHSLFALGIAIGGAYFASNLAAVSAGMLLRGRDGRARPRFDASLGLWLGVAAAACVVNPYHIDGLLFPLTQFGDIHSGSVFKSAQVGLAEFTSPFGLDGFMVDGRLVLLQPRLYWHLYTLLALAGLAANWRRWRLTELLLFGGFLYIFAQANKNFGYFVMASLPMAASGLDSLLGGIGRRLARLLRRGGARSSTGARAPAALLIGCSLVCIAIIPWSASGLMADMAWMPGRPGGGLDASVLPVGACDFINRHGITGRLLNSWNDGGYISWATRQPVFIYSHGNFVGDDFYSRYIGYKSPGGLQQALGQYQPTVAVVTFKDTPYWLFHLAHNRDWRLAYADEVSAVFLHRSVAPAAPALPRPLAGRDFPVYNEAAARRIIERAISDGAEDLWTPLAGCAAYPQREMTLSAFHLQTGSYDACIGVALAGQEKTHFMVPELMLNLGHALNARRSYALADMCFDAYLRSRSDPAAAADIARARRLREKTTAASSSPAG